MRWTIRIVGCDDETKFDIDLDDEEATAVREVSAASKEASEYGCQPVLHMAYSD